MNNQEIGEEIDRLENESNEIKNSVINLCWWMRGGISHAESWELTEKERKMINQLIKHNIETMKKSKFQVSLI